MLKNFLSQVASIPPPVERSRESLPPPPAGMAWWQGQDKQWDLIPVAKAARLERQQAAYNKNNNINVDEKKSTIGEEELQGLRDDQEVEENCDNRNVEVKDKNEEEVQTKEDT